MTVSILGTLVSVAIGCGLFYAGRMVERRKLYRLIDLAAEMADEDSAAMVAAIEAAARQSSIEAEQAEVRVH
jgi:hypothetical protein